MQNEKHFDPGDIVRVLRKKPFSSSTDKLETKLEFSGEYTLAEVLHGLPPLYDGTKVYKIETAERRTQRTVTYLETAPSHEVELWKNGERRVILSKNA